MTSIVLRLSAPLQSWSGYRHQVNMGSVVPTEAVPRKSAVNGLLGAALGPVDRGHGSARDLDGVGKRYDLHVRVERRNATTEDFQVLGPLPGFVSKDAAGRATQVADRSECLATAGRVKQINRARGGGNFPTTVARRDFLSHSEFIAVLETDEVTAAAWLAALKAPVFMPYLGRRSCAPTFPYILGRHDGSAYEIFSSLPHVDLYGEGSALIGYSVQGDYDLHHAVEHGTYYRPQSVGERGSQLEWAKENLS